MLQEVISDWYNVSSSGQIPERFASSSGKMQGSV